MAITTLDGVIAGMQYPQEIVKALTGTLVAGRPHSLFYLAGIPGAATPPAAAGTGGTALTTYAGQIPFKNPVSGNTYLARFQGQSTQAGSLILCDRLWHNKIASMTSAVAQAVNSPAFPARDSAGTTSGNSIIVGLELSQATGAGIPTLKIGYTNSLWASGKTSFNIVSTVASSIIGTFYPIGLAEGDVGISSIQNFTFSATWTTGQAHLVAYRILSRLELSNANVPNAVDALTSGFPRLFDNTVPFLIFIPNTTTTSNITGHVIWTQG